MTEFTTQQKTQLSDIESEMTAGRADRLKAQTQRLAIAVAISVASAFGSAMLKTFMKFEGETSSLGLAGSGVLRALERWRTEVGNLKQEVQSLQNELTPPVTPTPEETPTPDPST